MRKKIHIFSCLVLSVALTACTAFVDTRREAGKIKPIGQSTPSKIAVCYNPIFNNKDEMQALATQACESKKAEYDETKYFNCTLLYPNTAFYKCK